MHGARPVPDATPAAAAFALSGGLPTDCRQRLIADLAPRLGRHPGRRLIAAAEPTAFGPAGERIAHLALVALRDAFENAGEDSTPLALGRAFATADAVVRARNRLHEAGTETNPILVGITAAVVEGLTLTVAQVPPHRAILVQDGRWYPLPGSEWAWSGAGEEDDGDRTEVDPFPLGSANPVAPRLVRSSVTAADLLIVVDSSLIACLGREGRLVRPGERAACRGVDQTLEWLEGLAFRHGLDDVLGACLTLPTSDGASFAQDRPRAPWLLTPLGRSGLSSGGATDADDPTPPPGAVDGSSPSRAVANASGDDDNGRAGLDGSSPPGDGDDMGRDDSDPGLMGRSGTTLPAASNGFADPTDDGVPMAAGTDAEAGVATRGRGGSADETSPLDLEGVSRSAAGASPVRSGDSPPDRDGEADLAVPEVDAELDRPEAGVDGETDGETRAGRAEAPRGLIASETETTFPAAGTSGSEPTPLPTVVHEWWAATGGRAGARADAAPAPVTSVPGPAADDGVTRPGVAPAIIRVAIGPRGRASFVSVGSTPWGATKARRGRRVGSLTRLTLVFLALFLICGSTGLAHDRLTAKQDHARAVQSALADLDAAIANVRPGQPDAPGALSVATESLGRAGRDGVDEATLTSRRQRLRDLSDAAGDVVRLGNVVALGRLPADLVGDEQAPRLIRADRDLYLLSGGLYRVNLSDSNLAAALAPGSEIEGRVVGDLVDGAWNAGELVVTDGQAVFRMGGDGEWTSRSLSGIPAAGRLGPCATLATGFYVLDAATGAILKSDLEREGATLDRWSAESGATTLLDARAIVIDGRIHVLRADGTVATLDAGEIVAELTLPAVPPVTEPITMVGGLDSSVLWVLDQVGDEVRVIRTDPATGDTRAFLLDTPLVGDGMPMGITDMAVDEMTHTIYLLGNDALWRADLPVYVPARIGDGTAD